MSQSKEIGTLVVVILKARHLHQPSFYKQDPFAQAVLSGETHRTKPEPKGGQHPVWDEEFRFPVLADPGKDNINRKLEVSCWKDEPRAEDKLLGKGVVDIESTLKTGEFDDWVSLETSGGARGELYLEMTFYANTPPLNRRPTKLKQSDRLTRPQSPAQGLIAIPFASRPTVQ
ncbi:C2 domain-containing protein [Suillus subluteus]|nr:C2 domain-containing protein [Suillus subluteus]